MANDKSAVRIILNLAKAEARNALTAPEARGICEAYEINIPKEAVAKTAEDAGRLAAEIGFPVVMKIVSPQILHKTEAGGVIVGVRSVDQATRGYATIVGNARHFDANAEILGARAASSHTGALAGNDKIYDDVFKQSGVIRARSLRDLLEFARGIPVLPTPKGNNVVIITGAGGSGVLLSDACVDNGLALMAMPPDLDAAFRKFIPPFGAAGNPVDITGGEPPTTYQNTVRLGLEDPRIHALILGYWHTIITPPMAFARLMVEVVAEMRAKGIEKPVMASLAGDVEVEEAAEYLYEHGIPAYAYSTEIPVAVLGAKYKWARGAGLVPGP
jgi:acyl-CoA synthetase (NDP forming)